jgi:hypothetical protein
MDKNVVGVILIVVILGGGGLILWKGKDLLKLQIFQNSLFKQARFLASAPPSAQKVIPITESGLISVDLLPTRPGYMDKEAQGLIKNTWAMIHSLKMRVYKDGAPFQDEQVFIVTNRSYIPLDPNGVLPTKTRDSLTSLSDIAGMRHDEAMMDAGKVDDKTDIASKVVTGCFYIMGLVAIIALMTGKLGK